MLLAWGLVTAPEMSRRPQGKGQPLECQRRPSSGQPTLPECEGNAVEIAPLEGMEFVIGRRAGGLLGVQFLEPAEKEPLRINRQQWLRDLKWRQRVAVGHRRRGAEQ